MRNEEIKNEIQYKGMGIELKTRQLQSKHKDYINVWCVCVA